jgi:hypothetical protein
LAFLPKVFQRGNILKIFFKMSTNTIPQKIHLQHLGGEMTFQHFQHWHGKSKVLFLYQTWCESLQRVNEWNQHEKSLHTTLLVARSTVRAIRAMLPEEMADRTDDELLE